MSFELKINEKIETFKIELENKLINEVLDGIEKQRYYITPGNFEINFGSQNIPEQLYKDFLILLKKHKH